MNEADTISMAGLYVSTICTLAKLIKLGFGVTSFSLNTIVTVDVDHSCVVALSCV